MSPILRRSGLPGFLADHWGAFLVDALLAVLTAGIVGGLGMGVFFLLALVGGLRGIGAIFAALAVDAAVAVAILAGCSVLFFTGTVLRESYDDTVREWRARDRNRDDEPARSTAN